MGKFHNLLDAKFNPPRNWTLDTALKFDSDTLSDEGRDLLKYCGVQVTKKNVISVPKGYITDLASVPRFCWAFIAPFDVARAAAYLCSEESGLVTGSIIDYDQSVLGWHSYSAYDTSILDDSLLGE